MSIKPLVTIITPSYNSKKYIIETIDSVLNQTYTNFEMLIIDDCSNDGSYDLIKNYIKYDDRIKLYRLEKNSGCPAIPRNYALKLTKGEYIAFLDSDDIWHNQKLELQIEYMLKYDIGFTASEIKIFHYKQEIEKETSLLVDSNAILTRKISHKNLIYKNIIPNSSVVLKKSILKNFLFNEDLKYKAIEDYHMWLRVLQEHDYCYKFSNQLLFYRIAETSISKSKFDMFKKHIMLYENYKYKGKSLGSKKFLYLLSYIYFSFINKVIRKRV